MTVTTGFMTARRMKLKGTANIDVSAGAVNVLRSRQIGSLYESRSPEAVAADAAINWTDINGAYAESTADPDYLTDAVLGAVNPDGSDHGGRLDH